MLSGFLLLLTATAVFADDENGEMLVKQSCQRCHDNSIFTRPDSIIFSYSALEKRVHFCESMAHAGWSQKDFDDVIEYLNRNFYHFKR
jgi:cytochrome c2